MRSIPYPAYVPTTEEWMDPKNGLVHFEHDKKFAPCIWVHEEERCSVFVFLQRDQFGVHRQIRVPQKRNKKTATGGAYWYMRNCGFTHRYAMDALQSLQSHQRVDNVTHCFDVGNWLARQNAQGGWDWNEYYEEMFQWDPKEFGEASTYAYEEKHEALWNFIVSQCSGNEQYAKYFMKCLAMKMKNPFCIVGNIFLFSSNEGSGKSMLLDLVADAFGWKFTTTTADIMGRFSAASHPYAVWVVHEATQMTPRGHAHVRDTCTAERCKVEVKHVTAKEYKNFVWYLMATNPSFDKRSHFWINAQARRFRIYMSRGQPKIFLREFDRLGMLNPDQGLNGKARTALIELAEMHFDANFSAGGEIGDAIRWSDSEAWGLHVQDSDRVLNVKKASIEQKSGVSDMVLRKMADENHKRLHLDEIKDFLYSHPMGFKAGEFAEAYSLCPDGVSPQGVSITMGIILRDVMPITELQLGKVSGSPVWRSPGDHTYAGLVDFLEHFSLNRWMNWKTRQEWEVDAMPDDGHGTTTVEIVDTGS